MKATIERIKWLDDPKSTLAFLDICFDNMVIVKNWKIVNSDKGRFLAPPSQKGKDDKYYNEVYFRDRETADGFNQHILALADEGRANAQGGRPEAWTDKPAGTTDPAKIPGPDAPANNVVQCKSCGANIVWVKTAAGKNMPIDAETCPPGATMYDKINMNPHWVSCPNADQH